MKALILSLSIVNFWVMPLLGGGDNVPVRAMANEIHEAFRRAQELDEQRLIRIDQTLEAFLSAFSSNARNNQSSLLEEQSAVTQPEIESILLLALEKICLIQNILFMTEVRLICRTIILLIGVDRLFMQGLLIMFI